MGIHAIKCTKFIDLSSIYSLIVACALSNFPLTMAVEEQSMVPALTALRQRLSLPSPTNDIIRSSPCGSATYSPMASLSFMSRGGLKLRVPLVSLVGLPNNV